MTTTLTIADFLLARIEADEAAANVQIARRDATPAHERAASEAMHKVFLNGAQPDRIGDPARVLAECEAHRRIVELHAFVGEHDAYGGLAACASCGDPYEYPVFYPCDTLRALAAVYSDHEAYDESWAL